MKLNKLIIIIFISFIIAPFVFSQNNFSEKNINIYLFYGKGCPHCAKAEQFLTKLKEENKNIKVYQYEVWYNKKNFNLLKKLAKEIDIKIIGVPVIIIGKEAVIGFNNEETTGSKIKEIIKNYSKKPYKIDLLNEKSDFSSKNNLLQDKTKTSNILKLPLLGDINLQNLSLPALTIIIGLLDGFNPCAMWVLIFLITLLFKMKDRKKMWILGASFIFASGFSYFIFMAAWLNLLLFIGFIFWIRVIIGFVAITTGIYNIREYFKNKKAVCKISESSQKNTIIAKLKRTVYEKNFLLSLVGIIILAFLVNLVELVCSAGFPAIYTQILTLNNLLWWQYYLYLLIYIFFYMLDDLIVFLIAMKTLQITAFNKKYSHFSYLIGGILLLIIGFSLIFKPQILMFG